MTVLGIQHDPGVSPLGTMVGSKYSSQRIWIYVIGVAFILAAVNVLFYGNLIITFGLVFAVGLVVGSILRPSWGLYLLVVVALATEQNGSANSWTNRRVPYHDNLHNSFAALKGLSISPLELHLICIITGLILRYILLKEKPIPVIALKPMILYVGSLVFFILYGLIRGGTFFPALWETRGIGYLVILMIVVPQIIKTPKQVEHVLWAILAGLAFRAFEVVTHYSGAGFSLLDTNGWGNHEDAGLLATIVVLAVAWYVLKVDHAKVKVVLTILVIPNLIAIVASDRRSVYPIFAACFVMLILLLPSEIQRQIRRLAWVFGFLFMVYLVVFWETRSTKAIFTPVRSIREGIAGDDVKEAGAESYSSNMYRKVENFDLYRMVRSSPLLGSGYGVLIDYSMPVPIQWELGFYIPHNQILAVLAKTGIVGFVIFMFFYLSVMTEIAHCFRKLGRNRFLQGVLVLAAAAIVNHIVFSFFDIMLTYYRNNIFLGVLLGLVSSIVAIAKRDVPEVPASEPPPRAEYETKLGAWLLPERAVGTPSAPQ